MKTDLRTEPTTDDPATVIVDEAYAAFISRFEGIVCDGPITSMIWHAGASAGVGLADKLAKARSEA